MQVANEECVVFERKSRDVLVANFKVGLDVDPKWLVSLGEV